ncbi:MAG: 50S ribosomal protein L25 [Bdellovibrionota bacterium]
MSTDSIQLKAVSRQAGKHHSRAHRREQQIPAVIYGPKVENMNIYVSEIELTKYNKKKFENTIFVLNSEDKGLNSLKVLKKVVDIHPVTRRPTHVDFYALDMTKSVRVEVELRFEGKSIGIKEGGLLNITRRTIEVECLPTAIPEFFAVDITNLGLGDSLHASDVVATDVKIITLPTETICTIVAAEEEAATPVAAAADAAAPAAGAAAPAAGAAAPAAAAGAKAAAPAAEKKK